MKRSDLINSVLELYDRPAYLEIGVWKGETFHAVNASTKMAVDPNFLFDHRTLQDEQKNCTYAKQTSNEYFASSPSSSSKFDVIFLDGLHTFEQTLTDLLNAIERLNENGVIIIDDVIPDSLPSSLHSADQTVEFRKRVGDPSQAWMGDVYKLVFFIKAFMLNWTFATMVDNHGQLLMWRKSRVELSGNADSVAAICRKSYVDVVLQSDIYNVKSLREIKDALRSHIRTLRTERI